MHLAVDATTPPNIVKSFEKEILTPDTCKVALASDLHLDFEDINDEFFEPVADVLILAGDIHEERHCKSQLFKFWSRCADNFPHVIYIPGNHEYYHGAITKADMQLERELRHFGNVHFLQNGTFQHKGVTFVAATLWTDINKGNPVSRMVIDGYMNDWKLIRQSDKDFMRYRPQDSEVYHKRSRRYIENELEKYKEDPVVVATHHAPSCESITPRFKNLYHENYAYYTNLEEMMLERQVKTWWVHGHVHYPFDYELGNTRVLCNPRGYPGDRPFDLPAYRPKVFEIMP